MAAPIFEQDEINVILGCDKYLSPDGQKRKTRFKTTDGCRERKLEMQLLSNVPWPLQVFFEESIRDARLEVTFGLLADIEKRGPDLICHYDIQANEHENPPWSDGKFFKAYAPHKHVYCPENLKHGDLTGLRFATPIKIVGHNSFVKRTEKLFRIFCHELNITVEQHPQMKIWT